MAEVNSDLIGIIVACSVSVVCACMLVVLASLYCHRRLERKRREAAFSSAAAAPYMIPVEAYPPVVHGSRANSVLESKLSGYRPKILISRHNSLQETEYQEIYEMQRQVPNGYVIPQQPAPHEEQHTGSGTEDEITSHENNMQHTMFHNGVTRNGKRVLMSAVEPYYIVEPVPIIPYNMANKENNTSTIVVHSKPNKHSSPVQSDDNADNEASSQNSDDKQENANDDTQDRAVPVSRLHVISHDQVDMPTADVIHGVSVDERTIVVTETRESHNMVLVTSQTGPDGHREFSPKKVLAPEPPILQQTVTTGEVMTVHAPERVVTFNEDVFFTQEARNHSWKPTDYEEKTNSVDFGSEEGLLEDAIGQDEMHSGDTTASMLVRDFSSLDNNASYDDGNNGLKRNQSASDFTVLDYVDPDSKTSNTRRNFQSVMTEIVTKGRQYKTKTDVDTSADRVPPAFTSTPRLTTDVTSLEHGSSHRQRDQHDGSVVHLPDNLLR